MSVSVENLTEYHLLDHTNDNVHLFLKPDLASLLDPEAARDTATGEALDYYKRHTALIEIVRSDKTMEQVRICRFGR